jgi:SAM-dependent methyltransferase
MSRLNVDEQVAAGFGDEWSRFDQSELSSEAKQRIFDEYFGIFPWQLVDASSNGADFGCGSGRWASVVAPRVGHLYCVDASAAALESARRNLRNFANCSLIHSGLDEMPIAPASLDFAYSLGVLHHIPDTRAALSRCVEKLKPGAPLLLYLYYSFDNKPDWYRLLWQLSDLVRRSVSRLPHALRYATSQIIAAAIYWPLARGARLGARRGFSTRSWPLAYYADKPFYVMRTDALDRFGTRLEKRFSRSQVEALMRSCGLERIVFSDSMPFWCAVGYRGPAAVSYPARDG